VAFVDIHRGAVISLGNVLADIRSLAENPDVGAYGGYSEFVCRLFDDNRIEEFVGGLAADYGLGDDALLQLRAFCEALDTYSNSIPLNTRDDVVIADPRWSEIRELAKRVVKASVAWDEAHPRDALGYVIYEDPSTGSG
jgi:hypothetical protein